MESGTRACWTFKCWQGLILRPTSVGFWAPAAHRNSKQVKIECTPGPTVNCLNMWPAQIFCNGEQLAHALFLAPPSPLYSKRVDRWTAVESFTGMLTKHTPMPMPTDVCNRPNTRRSCLTSTWTNSQRCVQSSSSQLNRSCPSSLSASAPAVAGSTLPAFALLYGCLAVWLLCHIVAVELAACFVNAVPTVSAAVCDSATMEIL